MSTFFLLQNTTKKEDKKKNKINNKQKGEKKKNRKKSRYVVSRYAITPLPVTPLRVLLTTQITDLKQLLGLKKTKMVMYIIASKLNSTFGTIGSVTADKITAKVVNKLRPFALA